ncbi:MAG TPA: hypothetical protein VKP69_10595 [Isosphaeraceae bacterium]|nr:hypothetical protein [Isosphaeraceae bacterium]
MKTSARGCRCRVGWISVRTLPVSGPFWGVLVCTRCGKPHQWIAEPRPLAEAVEPPPPPPPWLVALAERHQGPPAELRGTERQRQWAETIRVEMKARRPDDPTMLRILDVVTHPGWFIRNRGDGNILHWPTQAEVAAGTDPAAQPADGDAAPGG